MQRRDVNPSRVESKLKMNGSCFEVNRYYICLKYIPSYRSVYPANRRTFSDCY